MSIDNVLKQRNSIHGDFEKTARLAQCLKATIRHHVAVDLTKVQRESLDLICTKIARICTGNPNVADHWFDIAGYAKLVYNKLAGGSKHVVDSGREGVVHTTDGFGGTHYYTDNNIKIGGTSNDDCLQTEPGAQPMFHPQST